jgi:hypothetical protein
MPAGPDEEIQLDLEPIEPFKQRIEGQKAKTANRIAIWLVGGIMACPLVYLAAVLCRPDQAEEIHAVFDKWFALVGPLAGAAVGAYYSSRTPN